MWLGSPSRPRPRPPRHGLAREVPAPPPARGVRTGLPRWLALTHEDPDIGRGARPARPPAPHARARLGCRTSRRVRAEGGPPGTSAPTISHPHPFGPDVGPTTARRAKYPRRPRRVTSARLRPGQTAATGGTQFSASVHTGAPPPGTTRRTGKWTATPPRTWGARREISVRNKILFMARIVI